MIPDRPETISRPKKQHVDTKNDDFEIKNNDAKHSSLSSSLDWPSADSKGPRTIAFFDPLT